MNSPDRYLCLASCLLWLAGCAATSRPVSSLDVRSHSSKVAAGDRPDLCPDRSDPVVAPIRLVSHEDSDLDDTPGKTLPAIQAATPNTSAEKPRFVPDGLAELEALAQRNPKLQRLSQEYQAARAKVRYIDKLPDPTIAANFFGHPIETAAGSQRANLSISQMIPWLRRLDAHAQQACFEAAAIGQLYAHERLRIVAAIRTEWYRLYALQKQIDIDVANQGLLKTIIDVANARVSTGQASQGDVLAGTLEYSKLEEQLVTLRQRTDTAKAKLNQLIGRAANTPISTPDQIDTALPTWDPSMLRDLAWSNQPEIEVARIRHQASHWGVEVARLQRRPNFTVNASWFVIDDNRPTPSLLQVGEDAWSLGAMMTVPLHHGKFHAIEQEALWKQAATVSTVDELKWKYDAVLTELWAAAEAAEERAELYEQTILPDARRTLNADQEAYTNGNVEFDRVIQDFRSLTMLELGYHQARAELAIAIAQIRQAVGVDLAWDEDPSDEAE